MLDKHLRKTDYENMTYNRRKYWLTVLIFGLLGIIINLYNYCALLFGTLGAGIIVIIFTLLIFPFYAGKKAREITKSQAEEHVALILVSLIELVGILIAKKVFFPCSFP